jgi:hypothetical protein
MLQDLQHLLLPDKMHIDVAGIRCRHLTVQSYAMLELTKNGILRDPEPSMFDVLAFLWIHSAPEADVSEAVADFLSGSSARLLKEVHSKLPPLHPSKLREIVDQVRKMVEEASSTQAAIDGETNSGNAVGRE